MDLLMKFWMVKCLDYAKVCVKGFRKETETATPRVWMMVNVKVGKMDLQMVNC